jgi:hypothetical protein
VPRGDRKRVSSLALHAKTAIDQVR